MSQAAANRRALSRSRAGKPGVESERVGGAGEVLQAQGSPPCRRAWSPGARPAGRCRGGSGRATARSRASRETAPGCRRGGRRSGRSRRWRRSGSTARPGRTKSSRSKPRPTRAQHRGIGALQADLQRAGDGGEELGHLGVDELAAHLEMEVHPGREPCDEPQDLLGARGTLLKVESSTNTCGTWSLAKRRSSSSILARENRRTPPLPLWSKQKAQAKSQPRESCQSAPPARARVQQPREVGRGDGVRSTGAGSAPGGSPGSRTPGNAGEAAAPASARRTASPKGPSPSPRIRKSKRPACEQARPGWRSARRRRRKGPAEGASCWRSSAATGQGVVAAPDVDRKGDQVGARRRGSPRRSAAGSSSRKNSAISTCQPVPESSGSASSAFLQKGAGKRHRLGRAAGMNGDESYFHEFFGAGLQAGFAPLDDDGEFDVAGSGTFP